MQRKQINSKSVGKTINAINIIITIDCNAMQRDSNINYYSVNQHDNNRVFPGSKVGAYAAYSKCGGDDEHNIAFECRRIGMQAYIRTIDVAAYDSRSSALIIAANM